jgi:hypothetical protein
MKAKPSEEESKKTSQKKPQKKSSKKVQKKAKKKPMVAQKKAKPKAKHQVDSEHEDLEIEQTPNLHPVCTSSTSSHADGIRNKDDSDVESEEYSVSAHAPKPLRQTEVGNGMPNLQGKSAPKRKDTVSLEKKDVESNGSWKREKNDDSSTPSSLDRMMKQESMLRKAYSYLSDEDGRNHDAASDCLLVDHQNVLLTAAKPTTSEGRDSLPAIDTSTEQSAALLWPRCKKPCGNCRTTHVAIPGSQVSETCVRISLSVENAPASTIDQVQLQCIVVPTDKYELSILGWLIWSTYAHRLAVRNATAGVSARTNLPKDFILTKTSRVYGDGSTRPKRTKHSNKRSFQDWWNGRRNLKKWMGQRWLVITFPWDMGDVDILEARFGAIGHLFTMPTANSPQGVKGDSATSRVAVPLATNKMERLRLMEARDDDARDQEDAIPEKDGKEESCEVTGDISEKDEGQEGQSNHAFDAYREQTSSNSEESSEGDDDDFM